jgi:hypothetical protein
MNVNDFFTDKMPEAAQRHIERFDDAAADLRQGVERECQAIRQKADQDVAAIEHRVEEKIRGMMQELLMTLKPMQDKYAKEGLLDEALMIRDRIRQLRSSAFNVQADPGHVHSSDGERGKSFLYDVTGTTEGSVYGTDVYTCDASLAAACVHAGVLAPGERGVVRVTRLDKDPPTFTPSTRHGISSLAWTSPYPAFRVARA